MKIYRITDSKYADRLVASGGPARWNSKGVEMLYFAESLALACLENAVHRSQLELDNTNFSKVTVEAPEFFLEIDIKNLPAGWEDKTSKGKYLCQQVGDSWIHANSSLILRVPSVIVPGENNFLVNPNHPDFKVIKVVDVSPFAFDPRLKL
jgi:RES domain-containing protein